MLACAACSVETKSLESNGHVDDNLLHHQACRRVLMKSSRTETLNRAANYGESRMDGTQEMDVMPQRPRVWSIRFKFFAGLAVAVMALLGLEGVLRLLLPEPANSRFHQINQIVVFLGTQESDLMLDYDPERFWKLKSGIVIDDPNNLFWQGTVSNSLGFRCAEFSLERSPESLRVVCFGDSSTFGIGSKVEDAWPSQLQSLIENYGYSGAKKVEVINAGVPGYSSHQGLQHMRQELDRLQPDVVMASYANNDFWHWDQTTDADHASGFSGNKRLRRTFLKSRVVQVLADMTDRFRSGPQTVSNSTPSPNQHWAQAATLNYVSPIDEWTRRVPLDAFRDNVNQMANLCETRRLPLILVKWPDQPQSLGRWSPRIEYQDVLDEVAVARGLHVADVVSVFQDNRSWAAHTYIPNDIVHVNRDGNRLAASAAFQALCEVIERNESSEELTN